jgi:Outer membrane protein beta-barrel domain
MNHLVRLVPYLAIVALMTFGSSKSYSQPFAKGDNFRLGIQMGLNVTRISGTELASPLNKTGMVIGAYYRQKLSKNLQLRTEVAFSLRGSRFDHGAENYYNAVKFTYLDVPISLMINTSKREENRYVVVGFEPAYLLQSEIYVNPGIKARYRNFGFKRIDIAGLVGYHFDFYYFGLQPSVKIGLLNINDKLLMPEVLPETGTNGSIRNVTFELKLFF